MVKKWYFNFEIFETQISRTILSAIAMPYSVTVNGWCVDYMDKEMTIGQFDLDAHWSAPLWSVMC